MKTHYLINDYIYFRKSHLKENGEIDIDYLYDEIHEFTNQTSRGDLLHLFEWLIKIDFEKIGVPND